MVVFACQRDSFLKEFFTTVISCQPAVVKIDDSKEEISCFEVVCEDTVLFPEGGGQPYDLGVIDGVSVLKVLRRGAEAVHYVQKPLEVGALVKQEVDWKRRFDHMQQHSGQHLITAIAETMLGYPTTSWWLGEDVSHIELDTDKLRQEEVDHLEHEVNCKIRNALPVHATVFQHGDPALDSSRTRGLPKDHVGEVRAVTIATVDTNLCCGTHVSNLAELQAIKVLGFEKGKKGKTNLLFLVGGRVLDRLYKMYKRELELNRLLKNDPNSHTILVDRLIKSNKTANKNLQNALKDLASLEIAKFKTLDPRPNFFYHYKKDAEIDYFNYFIREFNEPDVFLFLAIGEGSGHVVLIGSPDLLKEVGPKVAQVLDGKGNGTGKRFQAKVKDLKSLPQAVKICEAVCTPASS